MCRHTNGSSYICANSNPRTTISEQSRLSTSRSTRGVSILVRIRGTTENIISGLKREERNRNIGLDKRDGTSITEEAYKCGIFLCRFADPRGISDTVVISFNSDSLTNASITIMIGAEDVAHVFETNGNSSQRSVPIALPRVARGRRYEYLRQAVGGDMGSDGFTGVS